MQDQKFILWHSGEPKYECKSGAIQGDSSVVMLTPHPASTSPERGRDLIFQRLALT